MASVSDKGARFVAGWEGFRSCPYQDSVGVWTIGYGTTSATGRNVNSNTKCITEGTARHWLQSDLDHRYLPAVPKRWLMKQQELDALASFAYNEGPGAVSDSSFSTLARRLKSPAAVSFRHRKRIYREELPKWVKAGGSTLPGLVKRRVAEVALAVHGNYSGHP